MLGSNLAMDTGGPHIKWVSWIKDCSLLTWHLSVWSRTDAILNIFPHGHLFEVWDQDNFGITVGGSNKMSRDETKMTAFENRLTTRRNAFGFARKFVYGKRICWTKRQCVNLVRMISNMNIFGVVFDAWFRLMLAALVGSRKWEHRTNDWQFYDGSAPLPRSHWRISIPEMNKVRTLAKEQGSLIFIGLNRQLFINKTQKTSSLFTVFPPWNDWESFHPGTAELITLIEYR